MTKNQAAFEALVKRHFQKKPQTEKSPDDCPDENTVTAYLEGTLTQELRQNFESHAALCSRCQEELALLLKSETSLAVSSSAPLQADSSRKKWLPSVFGSFEWFRHLGLKPALAIVLATVLSGYVGLELFRQQRRQKAPATEVAESLPREEARALEEKDAHFSPEPRANQTEPKGLPVATGNDIETRPESQKALTAKKPSLGGEAPARPPVALRTISKDENRERLLRDDSRRDQAKSSDTDELSDRKADLETFAKEGGKSEAPIPSASSKPQVPTEEGRTATQELNQPSSSSLSSVTRTPPPRENRAVSPALSASVPPEAQTKADKRSKEVASIKKAKVVAGVASENSKLRQKLSVEQINISRSENVDVSPEAKIPLRIEVSGKAFELQNNVWTDLSINKKEERRPILIYKNSEHYQDQIKPLSLYQSILARKEDCLIEHEGRIYLVQRSP